jgi:ribosome-associated toxin RatA of RatAB toxin-antitoxin module
VAKKQTFGDKAKGKAKSDSINVKCIYSIFDESKGSWKFREQIVNVKDIKEAESTKPV